MTGIYFAWVDAARVDCTAEMNKARARADFTELTVDLTQLKLPLTKGEKPSETANTEYIKGVCTAMRSVSFDQTFGVCVLPAL